MGITKQVILDKYNEIYSNKNSRVLTFNELKKDQKLESLMILLNEKESGGGTGGTGGTGDASAANQEIVISQLEYNDSGNILTVGDGVESIDSKFSQFLNSFGNRSLPTATNDADNWTFFQFVRRLLSVKLDISLSEIKTSLTQLTNNVISSKTFPYTFSSKQTISNVNLAHTMDLQERNKTISYQLVVENLAVNESLTFEIQFSNNQAYVHNNLDTNPVYWSNISPDNEQNKQIVITENGLTSYIVDNISCQHIRFVLVASSGVVPTITVYGCVK